MDAEKIILGLAALMYYQSQQKPKRKKGEEKKSLVSFEDLSEDQRGAFISLAKSVLINLDRLNLKLIPKEKVKNEAEIEALLKARIEAAVSDFFGQVRIWKKDLIPQAELVARIYQVWATL